MPQPVRLLPELRAACALAERLGDDGRHLEALATWDAALRSAQEPDASPELLARAVTGRARALLELKRPACALSQLDRLTHQASTTALSPREAFALALCRAEIRAAQGEIDQMDSAFTEALRLAGELGDPRAAALAWSRLLDRAFSAKAWGYLLTEAASARIFARRTQNAALLVKASVVRANALLALGRRTQAEAELKTLLHRGVAEERRVLRGLLAG